VRAIHLSLHMERNPRALAAHDAAGEPAAALQHLPDNHDQYGGGARRTKRAGRVPLGARDVYASSSAAPGEIAAPHCFSPRQA
jgi:hypothetical protein